MKALTLPTSIHMKTIKSMAELFNIFSKLTNPIEAKELITTIVFNAISEIQEDGLAMTEKELEKRINDKLNDYLEVAKNTNVA